MDTDIAAFRAAHVNKRSHHSQFPKRKQSPEKAGAGRVALVTARRYLTTTIMNSKVTQFRDIPKFTRTGNYQINVAWSYIEPTLESFGPLDLDPDFQRGHVWNESKQIAFVEFILRGGKSSRVIYFNAPGWNGRGLAGTMQLVDGKQRLEAVRKFMTNELPIFGGSYFRDFTDRIRLVGHDFIFCVNDLATSAEVLQWYLDLNTGGVVHTDDEIAKVQRMLEEEKAKE